MSDSIENRRVAALSAANIIGTKHARTFDSFEAVAEVVLDWIEAPQRKETT